MTFHTPDAGAAGRRDLSSARGSGPCRAALLLVVLAGWLAGCGKNEGSGKPDPSGNELPQILSVNLIKPRTLTHTAAEAVVTARDVDDPILKYDWSATRGSFPLGHNWVNVFWFTPDDPGLDSLTVRVTDSHDTVRAHLPVRVESVAPPSALAAAAGTSIADLRWTASIDEGPDSTWQGYEVYAATRSFSRIPPDSLAAYRIAGPIRESAFRASNLTRGTIYFFRVGALRAWAGREERSPLTSEVTSAPRAEWTTQLHEVRNPLGGLAIDLSAGVVRPLDPADATGLSARDLYFGSSDPLDEPGPPADPALPRLKSVSLLANRNAAWASRRVWIKRLGSDWSVSTVSDDGWGEEVDLEAGAVYALKTPERNFGKLLITDLPGGISPYRQITVKWAFQSLRDYPYF